MLSAQRYLLFSAILSIYILFPKFVGAYCNSLPGSSGTESVCGPTSLAGCWSIGSSFCSGGEAGYRSFEIVGTCGGGNSQMRVNYYCCSAGDKPAGCSGGSSCDGKTELAPVWLRVVEKSPSGGTIAWKPQGMGVTLNDSAWSGNGLDGNGNFQTYRAYSDFVRLNSGSITNPFKNFDLTRNKQGNLWIASPNILGNGINWSNHFCGIGRAAAPDAEGQPRLVSAQNTSACGPLAVDVEPRSGTCNAFTKPDVDGCGDWARGWDQNTNNIFGIASESEGYPGQYMKYLSDILNFVDNTNNPFNWVDIRYDEYWSFSYLARSSKDCVSQTTNLTFTPPTGYKCANIGFYVRNNSNDVSYRNAASTVRYNADGSCYLDGPLKQNGNLILIEIQNITPPPPPGPAPHGEINIPVNTQDKACFGTPVTFDYQAYSSSSPISRNEIAVRNAAWPETSPGYIPWVPWLFGTSAPALNRRDTVFGMLDSSKTYGSPAQQLFMPGNTYWFAQVVYDSQVPQRMCSGSPIVTYPDGLWSYCGNAVYSTTPKLDFYGNRPWKKIRIPANVTTSVGNLNAVNGNGYVGLSWTYVNNMPGDLLGFRVWRRNRSNPGIKYVVNNGEIIPISNLGGAITYYANDYAAVCDGVSNTYEVEVISGYISPYIDDNYGPVVCSSVRSTVNGSCYPTTPPTCSISPATATVFSGQNPTFTFTASSFNPISNTYERDITTLTETLNGASRTWATGTPPSAADMNATGTYSENFTLSNLANDTTVSMTISDSINSYTCNATIDVQKALINIEGRRSTNINADYSSYCNYAALPSTNVNFNLSGPTNFSFITPISNYPINPSSSSQYSFNTSTSSGTEEIKCIVVNNNGTITTYPKPIGNQAPVGLVLDGYVVSIYVVTGPTLNTEAWFQTNKGAAQYGSILNLALPTNISIVNPAYLISGNAYFFRGTSTNDYGSIFTFKNNYSNYAPNNAISIRKSSAGTNPKLVSELLSYISTLYTENITNTPANAANISNVFSRTSGSNIAILDHSEVNKNGGTYLDINYNNLVSETTKGIPILIRLKQGSSDGNMYINKNIVATGTNFKNAIFFAEGTITIDPTVTQLDGIFIAMGGVLVDCTKTLGACDSKDVPLNIRGSVISVPDISFTRNSLNNPLYANNIPGVIINYNPSIYFMKNAKNFSTINTYLNSND